MIVYCFFQIFVQYILVDFTDDARTAITIIRPITQHVLQFAANFEDMRDSQSQVKQPICNYKQQYVHLRFLLTMHIHTGSRRA